MCRKKVSFEIFVIVTLKGTMTANPPFVKKNKQKTNMKCNTNINAKEYNYIVGVTLKEGLAERFIMLRLTC